VHLDLVRVDWEEVEQVGEQKIEESFNLWGKNFSVDLIERF